MVSSKKTTWIDKDMSLFFKAISSLNTKNESQKFLTDILTVSELKMISSRLKIARMLEQGFSYVEIEEMTAFSSATIAKVSRDLHYGTGGYALILNRLQRAKRK